MMVRFLQFMLLFSITGLVFSACNKPQDTETYTFEQLARGFERPLGLTHAGDGSHRLFVLEQTGRIQMLQDGKRLDEPFLDISASISSGGERGLLGLAFHPDYAHDGRFFVYYTNPEGNSVLASYRVSEDANRADPSSAKRLLELNQPERNHNGGHLAFGPDGYLYLGLGDGGGRGDPDDNGQVRDTLLGSLLRLDVSSPESYQIPSDNPFADGVAGQPEIWAYGLRNPWRFSFDRETGELYIADVGQNAYEEVNVEPADSPGGANYGWNIMEASHCYAAPEECDQGGLVLPVLEYAHTSGDGRSVTGGYVYRGEMLAELYGSYIFGDFVSGRVWRTRANNAWKKVMIAETDYSIASFGEDEAGELYLVDLGGSIYRLVSKP